MSLTNDGIAPRDYKSLKTQFIQVTEKQDYPCRVWGEQLFQAVFYTPIHYCNTSLEQVQNIPFSQNSKKTNHQNHFSSDIGSVNPCHKMYRVHLGSIIMSQIWFLELLLRSFNTIIIELKEINFSVDYCCP